MEVVKPNELLIAVCDIQTPPPLFHGIDHKQGINIPNLTIVWKCEPGTTVRKGEIVAMYGDVSSHTDNPCYNGAHVGNHGSATIAATETCTDTSNITATNGPSSKSMPVGTTPSLKGGIIRARKRGAKNMGLSSGALPSLVTNGKQYKEEMKRDLHAIPSSNVDSNECDSSNSRKHSSFLGSLIGGIVRSKDALSSTMRKVVRIQQNVGSPRRILFPNKE